MPYSLEDLRYLETVVRVGSASAAGRELGVAPSTVYRRIAALEAALGVLCLARGGGVTDVGRELAKTAQRARASVAEVVRRATAKSARVEGKVLVTTVPGFAPLLTGCLADLARSHPKLHLELDLSDASLSVRDREADIALSVVPNPPPALIGKKLRTIRYRIYGVAELAAARRSAPWVVLASPMHQTGQAHWEAAHVDSERIAVATGSRLGFLELVRRGVGLGVLPMPLARRYPELVEVRAHLRTLRALDRPAWLLTHPELRDSARVSVVLTAMAEALGG